MCDKPRKVKPYLCSDCGTTNINNFYETSKGKCKSCQSTQKKKCYKPVEIRKVKPHLCKYCGATNPDDFEIGLKTTCHPCSIKLRRKTEPRKVKPRLCSDCGSTNPDDFNETSKGTCKSCQHKKYYKPLTNFKYNLPHLCKNCGTTDPTQFYSKRKSLCTPCDRNIHRTTDRIVKPSGIIIPDDITDPIQRKKYYKTTYAYDYYKENKPKLKEQRKINKKKTRIKKYCEKHNICPDEYLNDFDKYDQLVIKKRIIECGSCKSLENINLYDGYGYLCDTCSENIKINKLVIKKIYVFDFIRKAQAIHNNKPYTYENTIYKDAYTKVEVTCSIHGSFYADPDRFFKMLTPCSGCRKDTLPNNNTIIEESKKIYGDNTFDYSKVNYINKETKITLICKKHNHEFQQLFKNHKRKKIGCYHCLNFSEKRFNISKKGGSISGANKKIKAIGFIRKKEKPTIQNYNKDKINKFVSENTFEVTINVEDNIKKYKIGNSLKNYKEKIREQIRTAIIKKNPINKTKTEKILGCSCQDARKYIESKFEPWMNWSNYGKHKKNEYNIGWDIDHITPLTTANTIDDVNTLNHFTNLQPLCSEYNRFVKKDLILQ